MKHNINSHKMRWKIMLSLLLVLLVGSWGSADEATQEKTKPLTVHDLFKTIIADEVIQEFAVTFHEKETKLIEELFQPSSIKVFIKLVKDSKIPNKGEIIKIAMSFMSKKTNRFESLVDSMKQVDRNTAVETSVVFMKYLEVILPKAINKNLAYFNRFFNEDDVRKISGVLYDAFQQTPTDELLWNFKRLWRLRKDIDSKMALIRSGNFSVLDFKWVNKTIIVNNVRDLQRLTNIKSLIPVLPQLIGHIKVAIRHSIDKGLDEGKEKINSVDSKGSIETLNIAIRQVKGFLLKILDYVELEDIPEDVEKFISYIQNLDKDGAKEKIEEILVFMPSSDDIATKIDQSKIPLVSETIAEKVKETVKIAANLTVPNEVQDVLIDAALNQAKRINIKKVRFFVELIVNNNKADNEVYHALKHVAVNVLKKKLYLYNHINASSFSDFAKQLKTKMNQIDDNKIAEIINEIITDFHYINPDYVAIIASDTSKVIRDLLQDDLIQKLLHDPVKFIETVNKNVFKDLVVTVVDSVKLVNETTIYKRCLEFSNYDKNDRKIKVQRIMKNFTDELTKVKYGNDTIRKLQIDDLTVFIGDVVMNGNVKNLCIDIKGLIKLLKMFEEEENEELASVFWFLKSKFLSGGRRKDNYNDIVDLLEAIQRVLLHQIGENQDDLRVRAAVYLLKHFRNRAASFDKDIVIGL